MVTISWIDVVVVAVLMGSIAFGLHQGLLRQVALMLSLYVGTVLAAQFHTQLAWFLVRNFASPSFEITRIVAFLALAAAFTIVLTLLIWSAYRETKLPTVVMLDEVGGTALGMIMGLVVINLSLTVAWYALDVPWPEGSHIKYYLQVGLADSGLQAALRAPLPLIQAFIRPWLPEGMPIVLGS